MFCALVEVLCKSMEVCLGPCVVVAVVASLDDVAISVDTAADVSVVVVAISAVVTV